ncbi:hypothetical protein CTA2_6859 [Colletotrichum tanaceti]|uniref:Uncharacterized protein n=1 Tax=Colletotrichum tanaceti TaxID=1306861 RepID=A0A4U6XN80_9PEZI|nr:hypothetical protein CTA2_6859 [Colletotrichum tanaceti]TKW57180.1 hypothetical protein CTA1_6653 [Colletotrichum tanaceti]
MAKIRAHFDEKTITVHQAYITTIAAAAAAEAQRLDASPSFKLTRMTWIEPNWGVDALPRRLFVQRPPERRTS